MNYKFMCLYISTMTIKKKAKCNLAVTFQLFATCTLSSSLLFSLTWSRIQIFAHDTDSVSARKFYLRAKVTPEDLL